MSQHDHNLIARIIGFIFYQLAWHMILKHHPVTQKNMKEWLEIWKKYF